MLEERYPPQGLRLNIFIKRTRTISDNKKIIFESNEYSLHDMGFEIVKRDIGTGYHKPEGICIGYGKEISQVFMQYKNSQMDTRLICPSILKIYNIKPKSYMIDNQK